MIEDKIVSYIRDYFTKEEKSVLQHYYFDTYEKDDTANEDLEYQNLSKLCKTLIKSPLSEKYRIELGPSCSYLIDKITKTYIDDTTLVLTTEQEHFSVKNALQSAKNLLVLNVDTLYNSDTFDIILNKYKETGCNKIFLLMAGTLPGVFEVIKQDFFIQLKNTLSYNNIPNLFILDDCQGCGFIFRDYNIFDGILATGHVFIPGFDIGILFTKLDKKLGFYNKKGLNHLVEKINIILKHKDKALEFNNLLSEYFKPELEKEEFEKFNNQAPHRFAIKIKNNKFTQDQYNNAIKYLVRLSDSDTYITNISIRCHEWMIQSPEKVLEGLKQTKSLLKKISRSKELHPEMKLSFTNKKIIDDGGPAITFEYLNNFYNFTPEEAVLVKQKLLQYSRMYTR